MTMMLLLPDWFLYAADQEPRQNWGLAVADGRVAAIGPHAQMRGQYPDAEVVEASGRVAVPGFVNAHHHMYGVLSHGIPLEHAPSGFWAFLQDFWWPKMEDALTHELIAASTEWACLEMVRSGVTTFYDCLEAPHALPGCLAVEAEVVRRWGLRGVLSFEATQRVSDENGQLGLRENADFVDSCHRTGGLVSGMMCYHTTFTCDEHFIRQAFDLAAEREAMVHMHCAEGRHEPDWCLQQYGKRTVEVYGDWGVLGPQMLASQCVQITPREIELLAAHGVKASHMPLSNCEVGGGFAPVPEMLAAGVTVGLGTDGYVNNFFALMRGAFLMHKARLEDPGIMPARTVWHMATRGGAEALGLDRVGALHPGFSADLVLVDTDLPTPVSAGNLWDQLLLWRDPQHVDAVMCAGRWLMRDKRIPDVDEAAVRARCQVAARGLWARA
jgi:5-methylthioadenosine/S-adenosylhomocysteine deaminase